MMMMNCYYMHYYFQGQDGVEYLNIPLGEATLKEFLDQEESWLG